MSVEQVSVKSWHYKLLKLFLRDHQMPKDNCSYIRWVLITMFILTLIAICVVGVIIAEASSLFYVYQWLMGKGFKGFFITLGEGITTMNLVFGGIAGFVFGCIKIGGFIERQHTNAVNFFGKQKEKVASNIKEDSFLYRVYLVYKEKVCYQISYTGENNE